jgi:foldase protein PrsA
MRAPIRIAVAAAVAAGMVACADAVRPPAATVEGHQILVTDVTDARERFEGTPGFDQLAQQSDPGTARRQFEQAYLGQQIRKLVLGRIAEGMGIEVGRAEIDQRLDEIRGQFPSEKAFAKALADQGFTLGELTGLVKDQIIEDKLRAEVTAGTEPGVAELQRYYRSHGTDYEQTRVQHILVKKMGLAQELSDRLRDAPKSRRASLFASLARRHSTDDTTAKKGGELGWVSPGQLVEPLEAAMTGLRIGEVSLPVQTDFGIHVVGVTGRRTLPFEQVRSQIAQQVGGTAAEQAWNRWLEDAFVAADIAVNPRYGELDPKTGQVADATAEQVPGASEGSPTPAG